MKKTDKKESNKRESNKRGAKEMVDAAEQETIGAEQEITGVEQEITGAGRETAGAENRRAKDFAKYLCEKMEQFDISVTKLSERLLVSRKTIYRYINEENPPSKAIEMEIRIFFQNLEREMKEKEGIRYADDNDLSEEELELLFYELDKDELEDETEEHLHRVVTKQIDAIKDGLGFYNTVTQKFIVSNFDVFCEISPTDMAFVERVGKLAGDRYAKVISYLENIPMNLGMLLDSGEEEESNIGSYIRMIRLGEDLPKNKYRQIREGSKGQVTKEILQGLYAQIEEMAYAGKTVPVDILGRIKTVLDYTRDEWYVLFLYERLRRSDNGSAWHKNIFLEDRYVGDAEYMFLNFLKLAER